MEAKPSLSRSFLLSMLLIATVSIGLLGCLWTWQQYRTLEKESAELRERMLNAYRELLKTQVERTVDYVEYRKSLTEARLRSSIQERVQEAHAVANHIYERMKDGEPPEKIQSAIRESLRPIRFNQRRGYFFILDLDGVNRLMPDLPEFEGVDLLHAGVAREARVVQDIIHLVRQQGEGFYRYEWPKPSARGTFDKIAFVKLFEPYHWIIGTGEYLDDFRERVQAEVLSYLGTIRFGKDGYVFVTQWDGLDLTGPAKGRNMLEVTDVNGLKIVRELIRLAKADGGFLSYVMPKFPGMKPDPKLSYVRGIKDWQWYVGAGIYIDDIEKAIEAKRVELTRVIVNSVLQVAAVLLALMVFSFAFAQFIARKARRSFDLFTAFFDKGARESTLMDAESTNYEEFKSLARSANQMIEARNHALTALKESEEKYRIIVENSNDLIIKLNLKKEVIFASPSYHAMFGRAEKETFDQGFLSIPRGDDHEALSWSLKELDGPPYCSYHELCVRAASGPRWLAWSSRAVLGSEKWPVEYVAVGRDITEKKRVEEELRENREWLQSILDSIQAGVVVIDPETHLIREVNRAAAEIIGTTKEGLVDTVCHQHICPSDIGMCPITDLGLSVEQSERDLLRVDGTRIPILKTVNCATINGKNYLIESFLDLREKRRLESLLLHAQKMEAIGTLAGGIAHDFNNLLSPIIGFTELALEDIPEETSGQAHLEQVLVAAHRAKDLVQQILAFSRAHREQPMIPMDVGTVVKEALKLLRATLPASIHLMDRIERGTAAVDATQIHQVVVNLCTNAAHAMDGTGVLEVTLQQVRLEPPDLDVLQSARIHPGPYLRLSVSDTGRGMDKATLERIFEPYFTTKEVGKGTGLGLSVALGIIERHEGHIRVESEIGRGTVVDVYLPLLEVKPSEPAPAPVDPAGGTEHILVVDDDAAVADATAQSLRRLGYEVTSTTSSTHALELFRSDPGAIDLIVTDYTMPGLSGVELAERMLEIRHDARILLCTGYSERVSREAARETGIRDLVMKPLRRGELAKLVRTILDD